MTLRRVASAALLAAAIAAGTAADRPAPRSVLIINGYRVLAADFHVHSSMWSDGALTPWGLVLEAGRQGLDAIAITGHHEVWDSRVGRWFSGLVGGPTVLTGEEIISPEHHIIAIGVDRVVGWHADVVREIDEIHAQGGLAIAAHPSKDFSTGFDAAALQRLDGSEVCHPLVFGSPAGQGELERFASRSAMAAIGSSDFHGIGRLGSCRTFVFARDTSAGAILEAVKARRTVVYGLHGKPYGDPVLAAALAYHPELRDAATTNPPVGCLDLISRICGILGLGGLVLSGGARTRGAAS